MKSDKATKEKLLASAKQEFMEKGYMNASLRSICKNAGVTTGALYFFFENKEDLFATLVEEPLNKLSTVMSTHYAEELEETEKGIIREKDISSDLEAAVQIIHFMYVYYDEFQLVLTKSQGSRFEHIIDQFVQITESHFRRIADRIAEDTATVPISDFTVHWLAHTQIDLFVHMINYEPSEEKAVEHMKTVIKYFMSGWNGMFR